MTKVSDQGTYKCQWPVADRRVYDTGAKRRGPQIQPKATIIQRVLMAAVGDVVNDC
jgi:hypothetical protein